MRSWFIQHRAGNTPCKGILYLFFLMPLCNCSLHNSIGQDMDAHRRMIESLATISNTPVSVSVSNEFPLNQEGGHLQGIQSFSTKDENFAVVSGSSDSHAYYAAIVLGDHPKTTFINLMAKKPMKHAGGFQISDSYLAIGIEDNEARDRSVIHLYQLPESLYSATHPIAEISREGPYERSTAGCVAICTVRSQVLIVVGNWHTRQLDFYVGNHPIQKGQTLPLVSTITPSKADRSEWCDTSWSSYQNINLYHHDETLYLVGLASHQPDKNVVDLFALQGTTKGSFRLVKIATKLLNKHGSDFSLGGGVVFMDGQIHQILGCERNLGTRSNIYRYLQEQ